MEQWNSEHKQSGQRSQSCPQKRVYLPSIVGIKVRKYKSEIFILLKSFITSFGHNDRRIEEKMMQYMVIETEIIQLIELAMWKAASDGDRPTTANLHCCGSLVIVSRVLEFL